MESTYSFCYNAPDAPTSLSVSLMSSKRSPTDGFPAHIPPSHLAAGNFYEVGPHADFESLGNKAGGLRNAEVYGRIPKLLFIWVRIITSFVLYLSVDR